MNTNNKGDIGLTCTLASLSKLGYVSFLPVSEHSVVDIIACKNNTTIRLQVKYSCDGIVHNYSTYQKRSGSVRKEYEYNDFDYYAVYIPEIDVVCYIPITCGGKSIRWKKEQLPTNNQAILWFEDYLDISPDIKLCQTSDIITLIKRERPDQRKPRPTKAELQELLSTSPATVVAKIYGVSSRAIGKWAKEYEIPTNPRGFWTGKTRH